MARRNNERAGGARHGRCSLVLVGSDGRPKQIFMTCYYEAAVLIVAFVVVGRALEARAKRPNNQRVAETGSDSNLPRRAWLVTEWKWTFPSRRCAAGDTIIVRPARSFLWTARSSTDRVISTNRCSRASLRRSPRQAGDAVIGGTLNTTGKLVRYRATTLVWVRAYWPHRDPDAAGRRLRARRSKLWRIESVDSSCL